MRSSRWLAVTLSLVALVAGSVIASSGFRSDIRRALSNSPTRRFEGRLSGVPWRPREDRSFDPSLAPSIQHWLGVAAQRERDGLSFKYDYDSPSREQFAALFRQSEDKRLWASIALANAMSGELSAGARQLEVGSIFTQNLGLRSDASVLRLEQASQTDDVQMLLRGLLDADGAISANHEIGEAYFNRGLAFEKLGLFRPAVADYLRSLECGQTLGWDHETNLRIRNLMRPTTAQLWARAREQFESAFSAGDTSTVASIVRRFPLQARTVAEGEYLAGWAGATRRSDAAAARRYLALARAIGLALRDFSGESLVADAVSTIDSADPRLIAMLARTHVVFATAVEQRAQGIAPAATFDEAARLFDLAGSPMASVARQLAASARFEDDAFEQSLAELNAIESHTSSHYIAFRGVLAGQIGDVLATRGDVYGAFKAYERAMSAFEQVKEPESLARMQSACAHMLHMMGEPVEAWRVRRPALAVADRSGDPELFELLLSETAFDEMFERDWSTALVFYTVAQRHAPVSNAKRRFDINSRACLIASPQNLATMESALETIKIPSVRVEAANDLRFLEAIAPGGRPFGRADGLLTAYIEYSLCTGRGLMLPYAYLHRASARQMESDERAATDLNQSLALLEKRRTAIQRPDLRDTIVGTADDTFEELMHLRWRRHEDDEFFLAGEQRRGQVFLDAVSHLTSERPVLPARLIADSLKPGVALMVLTSSRRHVLVTALWRGKIVMHRESTETSDLEKRKTHLLEAVREARTRDVRSDGEDLYESLVAPLGLPPAEIKALVIVADYPFKDLPFSLLRDRRAGQYLFEQYDLLHTPSASVFVQSEDVAAEPRPPRLAVTVGNPSFDRSTFPDLASLPAASDESLRVAHRYPEGKALTGGRATYRNLSSMAQFADVMDIAAHTVRSVQNSALLDLVLAADGRKSGACTLREVLSLPMKRGATVVIASCSSAVSRDPNGDLRDFAGAFLAAGAGEVIATVWDIEDETSHDFSLRFHDALNRGSGASASAALRAAQMSMLRSRNSELRDPKAWGAFQLYTLSQ